MTCRDCQHYISTAEALKPRPGLDGFGYCKAGSEPVERARMFRDSDSCWLPINKFQERK